MTGIQALADALKLSRWLKHLDLRGTQLLACYTECYRERNKCCRSSSACAITPSKQLSAGARHSRYSANIALRQVRLPGNKIGAKGAAELAEALGKNTSLLRLRVGGALNSFCTGTDAPRERHLC